MIASPPYPAGIELVACPLLLDFLNPLFRGSRFELLGKALGLASPFLSDVQDRNEAHPEYWLRKKSQRGKARIELPSPALPSRVTLYPTRMSTNKATIGEWSNGRYPMQGTLPSPVGTGGASIAKFDRPRKQGLRAFIASHKDLTSVLPSPLNRRPLPIP